MGHSHHLISSMRAVCMCRIDFGEQGLCSQVPISGQFQYVVPVGRLVRVQKESFVAVASRSAKDESIRTQTEDGLPSLMIITPEKNV